MLKHQHKNDRLLKESRNLVKEFNSISRNGLEYIKLDKPYRKGWKRSYIWHDFVKAEKKYEFFEKILPYINTITYSKNKAFKYGRKKVEIYQTLKPIEKSKFNELYNNATELEKRYFNYYFTYMTLKVHGYGYGINIGTKLTGFFFNKPNWVKLKIKPNYITHVLDVDSQVYRRRQEINLWFDRNWIKRGCNPRRWRSKEEHINVRRIKQDSIQDLLTEAYL